MSKTLPAPKKKKKPPVKKRAKPSLLPPPSPKGGRKLVSVASVPDSLKQNLEAVANKNGYSIFVDLDSGGCYLVRTG